MYSKLVVAHYGSRIVALLKCRFCEYKLLMLNAAGVHSAICTVFWRTVLRVTPNNLCAENAERCVRRSHSREMLTPFLPVAMMQHAVVLLLLGNFKLLSIYCKSWFSKPSCLAFLSEVLCKIAVQWKVRAMFQSRIRCTKVLALNRVVENVLVPQLFNKFSAFYLTKVSWPCSQEHSAICPYPRHINTFHAIF